MKLLYELVLLFDSQYGEDNRLQFYSPQTMMPCNNFCVLEIYSCHKISALQPIQIKRKLKINRIILSMIDLR